MVCEMSASGRSGKSAAVAAAVAAGFLLAVCGCKRSKPAPPPPPPVVTVAQPVQKTVTDYDDFTGHTQALATVELRPRVQGFLKSLHFKAGAMVKKGQLLFVIDPAPFEAKAAKARADVSRRKAALKNATWELKSKQTLRKQGTISEKEVINATAARDQAKADVSAAEAELQEAELDLSYTRIKAPIGGLMSRTLVDVGNLVGASGPTLLATIVHIQPIYAYFNISERDVLEYMRMAREDSKKTGKPTRGPVAYLGLSSEKGFPHKGRLDYAANQVDASTGTIQVRGIFPNKERMLIPGLFCRVRIPVCERKDALLVSDRALGADQGGKYLLVVNEKNVVEHRPVKVGAMTRGLRVITEGLKPGEWVIVNGLQRVRPGIVVNAQRQAAAGDGSGPAAEGKGKAEARPKAAAKPKTKAKARTEPKRKAKVEAKPKTKASE